MNRPPAFASRLLHWFGDEALIEDLEGDLEELFTKDIVDESLFIAKLTYTKRVLSIIFSGVLAKRKRRRKPNHRFQTLTHPAMILNYFKIAWRVVGKNKIYSAINVLGLALGVCACLVIYLIVEHEFGFDKFHEGGDRIYRVVEQTVNPYGEKWMTNSVQAPLARSVRAEDSGFDAITGYQHYEPNVSIPVDANPSRKFPRGSCQAILAEPEYFQIFKYSWIQGNIGSLKEPFKVVLTESKARVYFGPVELSSMMGKEIIYDDSLHVMVAGIVKDWPERTDFHFTDFISYSTINNSFLNKLLMPESWGGIMHRSKAFVKLSEGTSAADVSEKLTAHLKRHSPADAGPTTTQVRLQPLSEIHFNPDYEEHPALMNRLLTLTAVAFFILVLAAINFINLSTAQSIRRSKEIGIRKVMGGHRNSVALQFLVETFVLTAFSVTLAALLINPVIQFFESFIPAGVSFNPWDPEMLLLLVVTTILTTLLAGIYPAQVQASCLPSVALKNNQQKGTRSWMVRKGLTIFQFAFSLFFIVGALVMKSQLQMIAETDRGFSTNGIATFWTNWDDHSDRPKQLTEKIKQLRGVDLAVLHGGTPMGFATIVNELVYKGKDEIKTPVIIRSARAEYIPVFGLRLIAGRNMIPGDSLREFVINQTFLSKLGFKRPEDALGESLYFNGKPFPIIGVVEDFHEQSFREPIMPSAIGNLPEFQHGIAIKISEMDRSADHLVKVMDEVKKLFKEVYPDETFDYHFIETEIEWMHDSDTRTAKLVNVAMLVTIFISALGVFGLVMFTTEIKMKEIAIRKVLGATVSNIAMMLSKEFIVLLAIAMVIAVPVSWYYMNNWLMEFAFRVNMSIWLYVLAFGATLFIGLATVSFHTLKAAKANPAKTLRAE